MEVTYRHRLDAAYFRTLIDRYYRQRPFIFWLPVQFGLVAVMTDTFILGAATSVTVETLVLVITVGAAIVYLGTYLTKWGIFVLRFTSRADFGKEATVTLSGTGIATRGEHVSGEWGWAAYPKAVRFPDGILLLRRGVIRWLPDSDIREGDAATATALVASKTMMRNVA